MAQNSFHFKVVKTDNLRARCGCLKFMKAIEVHRNHKCLTGYTITGMQKSPGPSPKKNSIT